jgi:drug/metabolite transporter (DMT)-like permease
MTENESRNLFEKNKLEQSENFSKKENNNDLQNEPKTFFNFGICQLSIGIIFTYIYIICSILLNLINRVIYHTYNFQYNFFFMFCQQFVCLILFACVGSRNETFTKQSGEISFRDFLKFKYDYLLFGFVFILNILSSFYGNQLVINVTMFVTLRKLVLVMLFVVDFFYGKKKITTLVMISIALMTIGTLLIGSDDFTADYLGYTMVIINNTLTIVYIKLTEGFKKKTKASNLKLLVYNSYLANPILLIAMFISGEYKQVGNFFFGDVPPFEGSYFSIFFVLVISCVMCLILNSSFFISNEKNSSLFTQLLSNSKDIFLSLLSYFFLKNNKFTGKMILGLVISTIGAFLASTKSICDNLKFGKESDDGKFKPIVNEMQPKKIEVED